MVRPLIGHPIINHIGREIIISKSALDALTKRNLLDRATFPPRFKSRYIQLYNELELAGQRHDYYKELGSDLSGANVTKCNCPECAERALSDLTKRYSDVYQHCDVNKLIAEIKRKRRLNQ